MNRLPGLIYRMSITHPDTVQCAWYSLSAPNAQSPPIEGKFRSDLAEAALPLHEMAKKNRLSKLQMKQIGEVLFNSLFAGRVCDEFVAQYEKVISQEDQILRIELAIDEKHVPQAAVLPWEFMTVPAQVKQELGKLDLATAPAIALLRRKWQSKTVGSLRLAENEALRIAFVVSSPENLKSPVIYRTIIDKVHDLEKELGKKVEVLELINNARMEQIEEILKKKPHILHFIGHAKSTGQIALNDIVPDQPRWIDAELFSDLLNRHRPRIIVFQACESAVNSGVLPRILEKNIPVIITMRYKIQNVTAQIFALKFYECLLSNDSVEVAVQEGRRSISLSDEYKKYHFAIPVIYSHVRDGRLFPPDAKTIKRVGTPEQQAQFQLALGYYKKIINHDKALQRVQATLVEQSRIGYSQCMKIANHITHLIDVLQKLLQVLNSYSFAVPYRLVLDIRSVFPALHTTLSVITDFCQDCKPAWSATYQGQHARSRDQLAEVLGKLHPLITSIDKFLKNV